MPHIRPDPDVIQLAADCFADDIPVGDVLKRAGVEWSTWTRWKRKGVKPWSTTLAKMRAALGELIAERVASEEETANG